MISAAGAANVSSESLLATSTETLSTTGPAMCTASSSMVAVCRMVFLIHAMAGLRSASPSGVNPIAAMVVFPSGPTRMPVSRSIAVSRGSDSGGSISRSSTVDPVAIPSNQGRPCRSRGALSPLAASTSRARAGDPSSHPGHETTTTSPLSNSLTNSW